MHGFGLVPKVMRVEMAVGPGRASWSRDPDARHAGLWAFERGGDLHLTICVTGPSQVLVPGLKAAAVRARDSVRVSERSALPVAAGAGSAHLTTPVTGASPHGGSGPPRWRWGRGGAGRGICAPYLVRQFMQPARYRASRCCGGGMLHSRRARTPGSGSTGQRRMPSRRPR